MMCQYNVVKKVFQVCYVDLYMPPKEKHVRVESWTKERQTAHLRHFFAANLQINSVVHWHIRSGNGPSGLHTLEVLYSSSRCRPTGVRGHPPFDMSPSLQFVQRLPVPFFATRLRSATSAWRRTMMQLECQNTWHFRPARARGFRGRLHPFTLSILFSSCHLRVVLIRSMVERAPSMSLGKL